METFIVFILVAVLLGAEAWFFINLMGLGKYGRVKPADQLGLTDILARVNDTENPWLDRIFGSPAYSLVPKEIKNLMSRVSADENEKVFGAVWTRHGKWKMGYLIATSDYLRYIQTFPWKEDDFFDYSAVMGNTRLLNNKILHIHDRNYQIRGGKKAVKFLEMYKNIQQGISFELSGHGKIPENNAPVAQPDREASITTDLQNLAKLHQEGALNADEYRAAKSQLLGGKSASPAKQKRRMQ